MESGTTSSGIGETIAPTDTQTRKVSGNSEGHHWGLAFLVLIAAIHGTFASRLGYFWDDWIMLLVRVKLSPAAYWPYFAGDRPTSAWVNQVIYGWMHENPLLWHLWVGILLWIISILLFRLLNRLWYAHRTLNGVVVCLFLAAPVFSQTYIAVAYTQQHLQHIFFLSSLLLLIRSAEEKSRPPRWLLWLGSLVLMLAELSITEYFAFLEFLRLPVLFLLYRHQQRSTRESFSRAFKDFLPFLVVFVLYSLIRLNLERWFPMLEAHTPSLLTDFRNQPLQALRGLTENIIITLLYLLINFPGKMLTLDLGQLFTRSHLLYAALSAGIAFLFCRFWLKADQEAPTEPDTQSQRSQFIERIALAALWILLGILPFSVIQSSLLSTEDPYHIDRTFLAVAPGLALLFTTLIAWLLGDAKSRALVLSFVIGLCTFQHMGINDDAVQQTNAQHSFFQQVKARIPSVQDNTAIVDTNVIFPEQGTTLIASALNILYPNPFSLGEEIPLWVYAVDDVTWENHPGFHTLKRIFLFNASKENAIFIDNDNQFANCVWVFSPEDVDHPHISDFQRTWIAHTALERIAPEMPSTVPDKRFFGTNDPESWCSLYQQAASAWQFENWEELAEITDIALAAGYTPDHRSANSPYEWIPLISSLYHSRRTTEADQLRDMALQVDPAYEAMYSARFAAEK